MPEVINSKTRRKVVADKRYNWITEGLQKDFDDFLPIGSKDAKASDQSAAVFRTYSNGIKSNNDEFVYNFDPKKLKERAERMVEKYQTEFARWEKAGRPEDVEALIKVDPQVLKWIRRTKKSLARGIEVEFDDGKIRHAIYRPYTRCFVYAERVFNEDVYQFPEIFPTTATEKENRIIGTVTEQQIPFSTQMANCIPCQHYGGRQTQCFPLFTYAEDGSHRRDNITTKARTLFQIYYEDDDISRKDIFHYVYALLHHPAYRTRYAENLKRELPHIPFVGVAVGEKSASFFPLAAVEKMQGDKKPDHNPKASVKLFREFAAAGKRLAELHVNYEEQPEFPLKRIENKEAKLNWRVETMKLTKDHALLIYNDWLSLAGIPEEVFAYRLGNRSALEWVIDQYRVTRDADEEITSDPNRLDDEEYIVRLIGQVVHVSVETLKVIGKLPELKFP